MLNGTISNSWKYFLLFLYISPTQWSWFALLQFFIFFHLYPWIILNFLYIMKRSYFFLKLFNQRILQFRTVNNCNFSIKSCAEQFMIIVSSLCREKDISCFWYTADCLPFQVDNCNIIQFPGRPLPIDNISFYKFSESLSIFDIRYLKIE